VDRENRASWLVDLGANQPVKGCIKPLWRVTVNPVATTELTSFILETLARAVGEWHSGEVLAARAGVTRPAVWKAVQRLKQNGYALESSDAGYRFEPDAPLMPQVLYRGSVGSTMDEVRSLARAGAPEFTTVLAERQTAGRGRRGRQWQSPAGAGLYFTMLLRPGVPLAQLALLPLLIGACVARSLQLETGVQTLLKWSNDVLTESGHKLAGILLETEVEDGAARFALLGIGINVRRQDFPSDLNAAALEECTQDFNPVHRRDLLKRIIDTVKLEYQHYVNRPEHALALWRAHPNTLGRNVTVLEPSGATWQGTAQALTDQGALLIFDGFQNRAVFAGDISLRHA
jgi:BirA family transcriptional regulator, biotin operon repressor / biotin---[acetyl-CoA-carboxylase] ligase